MIYFKDKKDAVQYINRFLSTMVLANIDLEEISTEKYNAMLASIKDYLETLTKGTASGRIRTLSNQSSVFLINGDVLIITHES